ncbi:MAG: universal stress protein [Zoogloeaceae bacterium]|nr:universal stress protein [Zoogloeaceae bacterium]
MLKALVPVDGSKTSLRAVEHVIKLIQGREPMAVILANVQQNADAWELRSFLKDSEIEKMQDSKSNDALDAASELLNAAGIAHERRTLHGKVAASLTTLATQEGCDKIIMGARGESLLEEILIGSVTQEVIRLTKIPVTVVK